MSNRSWAAWLAATVVSFGALEAHAVLTRKRPTLTAALRCWLGFEPLARRRHILAVLFALLWSWLVAHVVGGTAPNLEGWTTIAPSGPERSDLEDLITYEQKEWFL